MPDRGTFTSHHGSLYASRLRAAADLMEKAIEFMDDPYLIEEAQGDIELWRSAAEALEVATDLLAQEGYADDPDYRQEWATITGGKLRSFLPRCTCSWRGHQHEDEAGALNEIAVHLADESDPNVGPNCVPWIEVLDA